MDKHLVRARSELGSLLLPPATPEEEHGEKGKDGADGRRGWCRCSRGRGAFGGGVLSKQEEGNDP